MSDLPSRRGLDVSVFLSLLALVVGALVAGVGLGRESLWVDESYTWFFVRLPWASLLPSARIDAVNPPLYYALVKAFVGSATPTEIGLRLPSVLFHLAGTAGAMAIGAAVAGRTGRVTAGWMWALHPMAVWYAREARPYALAGALAAVTMACFLRAERGARAAAWILGGLALAAGLLSHYFFFAFAGTLVIASLLAFRKRPTFFRSWSLLTLLGLLPLAAWLVWFFQQGEPSLGIGWIQRPQVGDLALTLWNMASGYGGRLDPWTTTFGAVILLLAGAAVVDPEVGPAARRYALAGVLLPLVSVWLVSLRRPVFVDRYFLILLPWIAVLVALGARSLVRRALLLPARAWIAASVLAVAVGLAAAAQVHTAAKYHKEDWRALQGFLKTSGAASAALILSEPEISLPLAYYGILPSIGVGGRLVPACGSHCWWILRQPYTVTHAFTQSVGDPTRPWLPEIPPECRRATVWESPTGLRAWELACP